MQPATIRIKNSILRQSPALQRKLHCPRIGLDVSDFAELATKDVNRIEASIRIRGQTPIRIWNTEVLMVERIQIYGCQVVSLAFRFFGSFLWLMDGHARILQRQSLTPQILALYGGGPILVES